MALVLWLRILEICEGIRRGMNHTEPSVLLRDSRSEKPYHTVSSVLTLMMAIVYV